MNKKIVKLKESLGITYKEMGEIAGLSSQQVSAAKTRKISYHYTTQMDKKACAKLSVAFGFDPDFLFDRKRKFTSETLKTLKIRGNKMAKKKVTVKRKLDGYDISKLPQELQDQLVFSQRNSYRLNQVVDILKDLGEATVNDVLIELYHRHDIILKRSNIHSCMNKLRANNEVVSKEKGVYSYANA